MVKGLPTFKRENAKCEACIYGKQNRESFPTSSWRANRRLQLVHNDVCGPLQTFFGGCKYFLLFIDDFSRMTWVYFLKNKLEAFDKFKIFRQLVENEVKEKIGTLRTDNGGEFTLNEFKNYCSENGIRRHLTNVYTPQQNGVVERMNRTLLGMARSMLTFKRLSPTYWAEEIHTAVYLRNRSPIASLDGSTPYEAWFGFKLRVKHLRVFGDVIFDETESKSAEEIENLLHKLETKGSKRNGKMQSQPNWYELDFPSSEYESSSPSTSTTSSGSSSSSSASPSSSSSSDSDSPHSSHERQTSVYINPLYNDGDFTEAQTSEHQLPKWAVQLLKDVKPDKQNKTGTKRAHRSEGNFALIANDFTEPSTYKEAVKHKEWQQAMVEEYQAVIDNNTWKLVDCPTNVKPIGCKWVYRIKYNQKGELEKYRARLVAKGFAQQEGIDYEDTFAPTAKWNTIRLTLASAAQKGWKVHQMDVKSAFLNRDLQEEVYMTQPQGFEVEGQEHKVCKLIKALYRLKQAPRAWYAKMDEYLKKVGFQRSESDDTLYVRQQGKYLVILVMYVDDFIITGNHDDHIA
eukprot:PITA_31750